MPNLNSIQKTYDTFHDLRNRLIDSGIIDGEKSSFSIIRERKTVDFE